MTVEEFYRDAKEKGKEDYEMVVIEMLKDREYYTFLSKPRYSIYKKLVIMETGEEYKEKK